MFMPALSRTVPARGAVLHGLSCAARVPWRDTAAGILAHSGPGERVRHPRGGSSPPALYRVGRGAVSGRVPKSTFGTFFASSGASKYFCG